MDCPQCGHTNRDGAKFCAQCAASLPVGCPACGSELSPQARFCDQCGTPVAGDITASAGAATRKVVTVLFADLVGSTSFGERVDAESAREAMAEYHEMATTAIESAGGTVAKFIGDGVMALFGVPETAEDDADRAVAAGLALQRGFAPIGRRVSQRHGAELGLRVGINTGEIVLAEGDADVVGDAINTAARLEATCTPGHVLVGEETWRLTRSRVRYEVLGEVTVKGKDEPVATFLVADDEVRADDDQATPFVGRATELAQLREVYDAALSERGARLATVIGAPGVGKTRIAREFGSALGDDATIVELRCERAGTSTFAPITDLLRSIVSIDDQTTADQARSSLRELVAELDDADRVADLLASFVGAAPGRSTEEAFLAVRRLVEAAARRQPLVLVVDDIQWAEPLFLDLLEHLADWVSGAPAVLLGLARPELREIRPQLAEAGRTVSASIGLEGLDADETALLAARLVGTESLPHELIQRLPASTEGNPLFVRELMRMLVDDGVIEDTDTGWQLTIDAEAVEVPPTIQSLLSARLDRMPADERRLVEFASVVGPEFALGAVAEIADASPTDLRIALDRLQRRELVESTGLYWGDEPLYRFHHVLIRDAAYRRLLKRARADLHVRVGDWTERTADGLPGEHEVAIGYHFEQAHEYHRQLDDVDEAAATLGRRAAALFGIAAERALAGDDLAAAGALAERALARLDTDDELVAPMLVVAAEALLALGDVGRGRPFVGRLADVARTDDHLAPWAQAFEAQLTMLTQPDRLRDAESAAGRAADRLAELGDESGVAKARLVRAGALVRLGQVGACEAELDEALTAARSVDDRRRVAAVLGAAPLAALWGPSPIPRAGGRCLDVIRLLRITTGSPAVEATSVRCQAVLEALRGRFDTARTMLADARATVEELGLRQALGETDLFTGIVELLAGEPAAAEVPLRAAYEGLGRLGIGSDAGQAAAYLARAVLLQGRIDQAHELAATSAELAGENPQTAISAGTVLAEILAAQGRYDDAVAVATEAVERAEGTDIIVDHANACAVLAEVSAMAGDEATASRATALAEQLYARKAATVTTRSPAVGLAPNTTPPPSAPAGGGPAADAERFGLRPDGHGRLRVSETIRLSLVALIDDDDVPERFVIEEVADDDNRSVVATFGPDGLATAANELDRRRLAKLGDATVAETLLTAYAAAWRRRDIELLRDMLDDDYSSVDRRQLPGTRLDKEGQLAAVTALANEGDVAVTVGDPLVRSDHGSVVRLMVVGRDAAGRLTESLMSISVNVVGSGRLVHSEAFPIDDADGAVARFAEIRVEMGLHPDDQPLNEADRLTRRFVELFTAGARDEWLAMLSPNHVTRDRRPLVGVDTEGIAALADAYPRDEATRAMRSVVETIAVRGESLALVRWRATSRSGREWDDFHLARWTDDGLNELNVIFPPDRLDEALAELDRLGREADRLVAEAIAADAEFVDEHGRPFEPTAVERGEVIATRGDRLALVRVSAPVGAVQVEEIDEEGRLVAVRRWSIDRLVDAVEHLERRDLDVGGVSTAGRRSTGFALAALRKDRTWLEANLSAGYRFVDRRSPGSVALDRNAAIDMFTEADDDGFPLVSEVLASGQWAQLSRVASWNLDADSDAPVALEGISLEVRDTAGITCHELFSDTDLTRARERFEEFEGGGGAPPGSAHGFPSDADRWARNLIDRFVNGHDGDWVSLLAPEFVTVDRSPVVGYSELGADAAAQIWPQDFRPGQLRSTVETIAVRGDRLALHHWLAVMNDGSAEWDSLHVTHWNDDGRCLLDARYQPEALADAVAELDRLFREQSGGPVETLGAAEVGRRRAHNAATRLIEHAASTTGDIGAELFSEDFVGDDRRSTVSADPAGPDESSEGVRSQPDPGVTWPGSTLATRGEYWALFRSTAGHDGSLDETLVVIEADDTDRIRRIVLFDPDDTDAAYDELDRAWLATLDAADVATYRLASESYQTYVGLDGDRLDEITAPDHTFVDHRRLGNFGTLDRAGFFGMFETRRTTRGPGTARTRAVHHLADGVLVWSTEEHTRTDAGAETTTSGVFIMRVVDGRAERAEIYDPDDLDRALARATELAAEPSP